MKIDTPEDFQLSLGAGAYRLLRESTPARFAAPASTRGVAKLYTLSDSSSLVYVGITQQPMSSRLSYGFRANGELGYYGYKWKGRQGTFRLSVWTARTNGNYVPLRELETIEAEVAFLCRERSGQWPTAQCEIHFYPSLSRHRDAATRIYEHAVRAGG